MSPTALARGIEQATACMAFGDVGQLRQGDGAVERQLLEQGLPVDHAWRGCHGCEVPTPKRPLPSTRLLPRG